MKNTQWSQWPIEARLSALTVWADEKGILPILQQDYQQPLARMMEPEELVGPTGETNELYLVPRGVFIATQSDETENAEALRVLISRALLAGNRIQLDSTVDEQLTAECLALGFQLPEGTIVTTAGTKVTAEHAGVICVGHLALQQRWRQEIAQLSGAIVPVIGIESGAAGIIDPNTALQWVYERTRTINVTAIGGNASLLALNDER